MKKLPKFNEHNCYCEQMVTYNFLFSKAHINGESKENIIKSIDKYYQEKLKKYDIEAIKNCIIKNYDNYIKKPFIASNYSQVSESLPL